MHIASSLAAAGRVARRRYAGRDGLGEYARILRSTAEAGYELISLAEFDVPGNQVFYELELAAGARSTFYFRWSTARAHERLIGRLLADGFEVGYHYEEGATIAKRRCLSNRAAVEARRDEIADLMRWRVAEFRRRWNPDLGSAASHGDWINRRLRFTNAEMAAPELLAECGLAFEAYGEAILGRADTYVSDVATHPSVWRDDYSPNLAVADGHRRICVLTHERRWHANLAAGVDADMRRIADEASYRLRHGLGRVLHGDRHPPAHGDGPGLDHHGVAS